MKNIISILALAGISLSPLFTPGTASAGSDRLEDAAEIAAELQATFSPRFAEQGLSLSIIVDRESDYESAFADSKRKRRLVVFPKGFLVQPGLTREMIYLSGCHELGHHLGGAPFIKKDQSVEGQADYWAARECLPLIFERYPSSRPTENPRARALCDANHWVDPDVCARILDVAESFWKYAYEWQRTSALPGLLRLPENEKTPYLEEVIDDLSRGVPPSLDTPSTEVVPRTLSGHPLSQCRIDTYAAGVADRPRPTCWYR